MTALLIAACVAILLLAGGPMWRRWRSRRLSETHGEALEALGRIAAHEASPAQTPTYRQGAADDGEAVRPVRGGAGETDARDESRRPEDDVPPRHPPAPTGTAAHHWAAPPPPPPPKRPESGRPRMFFAVTTGSGTWKPAVFRHG